MVTWERYERQLSVPGFGARAQHILQDACAAIVGCGGLGAPAALYLAAAGVGELVLIDDDLVEESNLNRHVLCQPSDVGTSKVLTVAERLKAFNPDLDVRGIPIHLDAENARRELDGAEVVLDCLDSFEARFALNDAALALGIPLIHGACMGLMGRVMSVSPGKTPCLRCLYISPSEGVECPIIGGVAGTVGCLQAMECIKILTGVGKPMFGKLLTIDVVRNLFDITEMRRRPECSACGSLV
ncbi:MAG: HesA/MoeB/ThiF family protein [Candidatus Thermoplasmatota archaeon]